MTSQQQQEFQTLIKAKTELKMEEKWTKEMYQVMSLKEIR